MKKIFYMSAILGASVFGLVGCSPTATNTVTTNKVMNANSNIAVVVNSNANTMMNANMSSNMNANMSSNANAAISSSDKEFMGKALQGGLAEVQLGGLAIQRAQSEEVKAFGQKMVTDHSKANSELKTMISQKKVDAPSTTSLEQVDSMSKLAKLTGAAFDKEYVRMMIEDHEKDVAEFQKEINTGSDADTKDFAIDTLPTLKMHLEMIKNLSAKIK